MGGYFHPSSQVSWQPMGRGGVIVSGGIFSGRIVLKSGQQDKDLGGYGLLSMVMVLEMMENVNEYDTGRYKRSSSTACVCDKTIKEAKDCHQKKDV